MAIFPHGSAGEACRREPRFATARFARYALTSLRLTKEMKSRMSAEGFSVAPVRRAVREAAKGVDLSGSSRLQAGLLMGAAFAHRAASGIPGEQIVLKEKRSVLRYASDD